MPNREALGRTVNVVPIAAGVGLSLKGSGGITFVCTGNDTFTITVAAGLSGSYATPGSIITTKHTTTTAGTAAWTTATQSASNAVTISSGVVAFFVGEDMLPDGKTHVKVHAEQRRARHRRLQRPEGAAGPGEPADPVRLSRPVTDRLRLLTGHDLASCPVCGSRACLAQAPGLMCRHTRRPRPTLGAAKAAPTPPAQRRNR
jgi:hypothetical protein